jgi:ketosteroid isomerase-like protein
MDGFRKTDHEQILSCLTEDVRWTIPGGFDIQGLAAFDKEIENAAFMGHPVITVTRLTEENDVVVAEGFVGARRRDGTVLNLAMCDVFEMKGGKIRHLTSYLMDTRT